MKLPLMMTLHLAENLGLAGTVAVSGEKPRRGFHYRYVPTSEEDGLAVSIILRDKNRVFMVELGDEHIRTALCASMEIFTAHNGLESMDLWLKEWPEQATEPQEPSAKESTP